MALDEVIMQAHSAGEAPSTVRFLQFEPCALLGLHQNAALELNLPYCRAQGIAVNRRITGGGSLYWGPLELGWEMYAAKSTPGIPRKVEELYRLLCEGTALGLERLGVDAAYRPVNDIEVRGRKIAGTGGTELDGSFVFQCSLLVAPDIAKMAQVLRIPGEKLADKGACSLAERMTSLREQLGYIPDSGVIKRAILAGLGERLGIAFYPGALTAAEAGRLKARLAYFQSDEWVYGEAGQRVDTIDAVSNYKAPGGLIRVQLRLDDRRGVIKYVMISGDFFAYPARVVNDLEAVLKNTPVNPPIIAQKINAFFAGVQVEIPGVAPAHFISAVAGAVRQAGAAAEVYA